MCLPIINLSFNIKSSVQMRNLSLLSVILSYIYISFATQTPLTPTFGVPKSIKHQYDINLEDFLCLDGTKSVPFSFVNDNFCDCPDGTDEPGTAACPNGQYHCINAGYRPTNIPSVRVNDGICDCCDGTDEYEFKDVKCPNTCIEMYREEKQKAKVMEKLHIRGYEAKKNFIESAKENKAAKIKEIEEIKIELETIGAEVDALEKRKNEAEEVSNAVIQKHNLLVEQQRAEIRSARIQSTFEVLDINKDGNVSLDEIETAFPEDRDVNQVADHTQFVEVFGNMLTSEQNLQLEDFKEKYEEYMALKKYLAKQEKEKESEQVEEPVVSTEMPDEDTPDFSKVTKDMRFPKPYPETEDSVYNIDDDKNIEEQEYLSSEKNEDEDDDDDDYESSEDRTNVSESESDKDEENEILSQDYDEGTQVLIKETEEAKSAYESKKSILENIQNKLKDVENFLQMDLGETDVFYPLMDNCFDYTDKEYTYTVCPFKKCTQKQLNSGRETSLGTWGQWEHKTKRYGAMIMRNGEKCWNGPDRSSLIRFTCGESNKLVSVDEPSRCEYSFEFQTPAMCQNLNPGHSHEEL